jgi:hypothetical protein
LGYEASNAEAQEKSAVWSADLGNAERPLRTNAQNSTNGGGKKHTEAPEQCGYAGSTVIALNDFQVSPQHPSRSTSAPT